MPDQPYRVEVEYTPYIFANEVWFEWSGTFYDESGTPVLNHKASSRTKEGARESAKAYFKKYAEAYRQVSKEHFYV